MVMLKSASRLPTWVLVTNEAAQEGALGARRKGRGWEVGAASGPGWLAAVLLPQQEGGELLARQLAGLNRPT